MAQVIKVSDLP
ncbi:hypothetical protein PENANT_c037G08725 [Penicillium antarcticum]|uniref:Uncharacterized protein n=1 Tax=Penicillium antarcticum TaxID=416450 RepID=A0A1V6PTC1_9EURO|nr:hypothetical protein PENANT_c037G08725 [Penicillium antarcticum]